MGFTNSRKYSRRRLLITGVVILLLMYGILAVIAYFIYAPHQFKNGTYIGPVNVSGQNIVASQASIQQYLDASSITIAYDNDKITSSATSLGAHVSQDSVERLMSKQRQSGLLLPFFYKKKLEIPLDLHQNQFAYTTQAALKNNNVIVSTPAYYSFDGSTLRIVDGINGLGIDSNDIQEQLKNNLANGQQDIVLTATLSMQPPITQTAQLEELRGQAQDIITMNPSVKADETALPINIATLVANLRPNYDNNLLIIDEEVSKDLIKEVATKATLAPVNEVISSYVSGKPKQTTQKGAPGKTPNNIDQLAQDLKTAIDSQSSFSGVFSWDEIPYITENITINDLKVFTYKITSWGVIQSDIEDFRKKVAETLASPKGWVQSDVSFREVTSGEQFEIVLSEASELPARYPNVCDATYSCRVGRYVIINDDRWRLATPPWTGTIRDYQHMVINHEVGHWLGQKHVICPVTGQLSPVMQQQSINLNGCIFNPWPLPNEIINARTANQ